MDSKPQRTSASLWRQKGYTVPLPSCIFWTPSLGPGMYSEKGVLWIFFLFCNIHLRKESVSLGGLVIPVHSLLAWASVAIEHWCKNLAEYLSSSSKGRIWICCRLVLGSPKIQSVPLGNTSALEVKQIHMVWEATRSTKHKPCETLKACRDTSAFYTERLSPITSPHCLYQNKPLSYHTHSCAHLPHLCLSDLWIPLDPRMNEQLSSELSHKTQETPGPPRPTLRMCELHFYHWNKAGHRALICSLLT